MNLLLSLDTKLLPKQGIQTDIKINGKWYTLLPGKQTNYFIMVKAKSTPVKPKDK